MQNMQNQQQQQQQQMAMAMNAGMGGPVNGTPVMANLQRPGQRPDNMPVQPKDPFQQLNTYIYDYFIRNNQRDLAKAMVDSEIKMNLVRTGKTSPNGRNVNGVDGMDDGLPRAELPADQLCDNSFLGDWWCQFWDIWSATRNRGQGDPKSAQYAMHTRSLAQIQNDQRNQRMMMGANMTNMSAQQYQNMLRMQNNVGANNDLKRQAMNNQNRTGQNPMANMQMNKQAMMSAQMQRDGSGMDMNGQRPQSPGSADNAPSPNKRPRVDGPMNTANMGGNSFNEFGPQGQNVQQKSLEGMNAGVQGSPMAQHGLEGQHDMFAGNQQRPGMPAGAPGQPQQGNHALQDYQMQLMLLEQQNKKRLLMARQEQDSGNNPHGQAAASGQNFASVMSPQAGNRAGPSPNPADMKRGTPKLGQVGLPASPMPDAAMQQQRNSPAPNMGFDPNQMPPGMPPQFAVPGAYPQMPQNPMMRPPSSHPGAFNGQPMTQQQMEAMQQQARMQNGGWRGPGGPGGPGPQGPQGMMPGQGQPMAGPMNPQQQRNPMPPPPAPPAGEQPRAQEPSPSQPAPAPPTPNQGNKPNPKKKPTKNDKPAKAKGANTGATPAASGEDPPPTPTPSTPITPMHAQSFGQNGQPKAGQPQGQPQPPAGPPQANMDNNSATNFAMDDNLDFTSFELGTDNDLNSFDFDSFLHVGDEPGFGGLGPDFFNTESVEAGGDI